jgi:hypothetical protein
MNIPTLFQRPKFPREELMKPSTLLIAVLALLISTCASKPIKVNLTVYFTDINRYAIGTEPYEKAVTRNVPINGTLPEMVLTQVFLGPTPTEKALGLDTILSGTTGFRKLTVENGVAHVYLTGKCNSGGATYTIGNLIFANLAQFPEIRWVKIYDENGETETPSGPTSSIPVCLEP